MMKKKYLPYKYGKYLAILAFTLNAKIAKLSFL